MPFDLIQKFISLLIIKITRKFKYKKIIKYLIFEKPSFSSCGLSLMLEFRIFHFYTVLTKIKILIKYILLGWFSLFN